jgi:hypothetical protein
MAKQETVYKAVDGKKFKTAAESDRHDAILTAKDEYDTARRKLAIALLANERTADGEPVDICSMTLYCVVNKFYAPVLQECRFYWNAWDWGLDRSDRPELYFKIVHGDHERQATVTLDDLYADVDKARQAVIEAKREILKEKTAEIAAMEANPRTEIRVNY